MWITAVSNDVRCQKLNPATESDANPKYHIYLNSLITPLSVPRTGYTFQMRAIRPRTVVLFILLVALICIFWAQSARAADTAGCHTITDEERAALKEVGATIPANGQFCDKDKVLLYGSCAESPYSYLETKKTGSNVDVAHLNADYACRLYKFLKAADAAGKNIRITSAYRSVELQKSLYAKYQKTGGAPVAPPGRSKHNYGIAADLTFDGVWPNYVGGSAQNTPLCLQRLPSCKWAHDNSGNYGLRWPMVVEPWHIEPGTDVKGLQQLPTDPNYWSSDDGTSYTGAPLQQSLLYQTPITTSPIATPAQTTSTQTSGTTQTQPQVCTPSYSCSGGTMYYQTSSCTTQVYQLCVYGCDGSACKTASTTSSAVGSDISGAFASTSSSTSDDTGGNDNTNIDTNTNISDILDSLSIGDMFTSTDVGTSAPLSLNPSIFQSSSLHASNTQYPAGTLVSSGTIQSIQPIGSQSTFASQDLANNAGYIPVQSNSVVFSMLEGMKNALLGALNFLLSLGR
jgi:hypothetical protein